MKSKTKTVLGWIGAIVVGVSIPCAIVANKDWGELRSKVGRDKSLLSSLIIDNYSGKTIDEKVLPASRNQVHNKFNEAFAKRGKFVSIGQPDTLPSIEDALKHGRELSYNYPVQFEKGCMTFTFRVRNSDQGDLVIWSELSDGLLARDNIKTRLAKHLP